MERGKKKQLSLGVVFSYITIIVQCLSGVAYTPIILSSLGQSEYGVYSLCLSFSGCLTIFNGGMNAAFVRFYVQAKTRDEGKLPALNGLFARVFIGLAAVALAAGLVISWKAELFFGSKINVDEYALLKELFAILAASTCVTVINCIFSSLITANEQFIFGKLVNLLQIVLAPVITIPLLLGGHGAAAVFAIKLLLTVVAMVFNAWYCFARIKARFEFSAVDKVLLRSILVFAGAIAVQSVTDQLNWQVDKFVLAWTNGTSEVSVYSVGSMLNAYYIMIASAMSGVFIAEINRLAARGRDRELSDLFVKTSRIFALLVLLIMSGYCIFGKDFIMRWAGVEYGASYYVGLLIMLPVTPVLIMGLAQDITRAKNRHKMLIAVNTLVSLLNLVISIPLAMKFGAVGSAVGTFITEILIIVVIESIYWHRVVKLDIARVYMELLKMLRGLAMPFLFGCLINHFGFVKASWSSLFLWGVAYVAVYAVSMWLFAMNQYERRIAKKTVRKVRNRLGRIAGRAMP